MRGVTGCSRRGTLLAPRRSRGLKTPRIPVSSSAPLSNPGSTRWETTLDDHHPYPARPAHGRHHRLLPHRRREAVQHRQLEWRRKTLFPQRIRNRQRRQLAESAAAVRTARQPRLSGPAFLPGPVRCVHEGLRSLEDGRGIRPARGLLPGKPRPNGRAADTQSQYDPRQSVHRRSQPDRHHRPGDGG